MVDGRLIEPGHVVTEAEVPDSYERRVVEAAGLLIREVDGHFPQPVVMAPRCCGR